jgi:serine O-acetyltransferase
MADHQFISELFRTHSVKTKLPSPLLVQNFIDNVLSILFPAYSDVLFKNEDELNTQYRLSKEQLMITLSYVTFPDSQTANTIVELFYQGLPKVYELLLNDAEAIEAGDPAAKNRDEVIRSYPGFYAISVYRVAHLLHQLQVPFIPRILTELGHSKTGIDIHPAATIGHSFFIDHGTGVVVGETAHIGNHVKLYQGVTLGALSVSKDMAETKRHPTIEDNVVIYAGATILGGKTVIGKNSTIGGNVWLTKSIEPNTLVYHKPQLTIQQAK